MTSQEFLKSIGACPDGANAVGTRTLKVAVGQSVRPDWLYWLAAWNAGQRGWPARADVVTSLGICLVRIAPSDSHVFTYLNQASRAGSRESFIKRIRETVECFPREEWAKMCDVFRETLDIPFLETLDQ